MVLEEKSGNEPKSLGFMKIRGISVQTMWPNLWQIDLIQPHLIQTIPLFVTHVTCWWLYHVSVSSVVGAPSHITLIGTGSLASAHQRKLSQMVSALNTQVHLSRYYSIVLIRNTIFCFCLSSNPLCCSSLMCFSFCPHIPQNPKSMSGESLSEWRRVHADPTQILVWVLLCWELHWETLWAEWVD